MDISRRDFIKKHAKLLFFLGVGSLFSPIITKRVLAQPTQFKMFRPPGAVNNKEFLSKCIRCFKCGEACPFGTIKFVTLEQSLLISDTPYLANLQKNPCYLCMKCTEVCPTGALNKISYTPEEIIQKAKIGVAVINEQRCVIYNGERRRCHKCLISCPFRHKAIYMGEGGVPVIDPQFCVGCGICVNACPYAPEALQVVEVG